MSSMPLYPQDENALVKLTQAHDALDKVQQAYADELNRAMDEIDQKHSPFMYAAQSVLYEAMGNAAMAGFTKEQMVDVMACEGH
jgi:hypothetical protein